jgi:hypothetical protein
VAKVVTSKQDRTISLKAAVRICINKKISKPGRPRAYCGRLLTILKKTLHLEINFVTEGTCAGLILLF